MSILQDIQKLNAGTLIVFYALDLSTCVGKFGETTTDKYLWCDGVNELGNDVVWSGRLPGIPSLDNISSKTFTRYPVQTTGFDKSGDGTIPRPKLAVSNYSGVISALARQYNDLVGAKLIRVRTFLKYIDSINFKKLNLLKYSNNTLNAIYFTNGVTKGANNEVTITNITDPYIGQLVSSLGSINNRTFTFGIKASTTTAVGKYLRLFIYSSSVNEVYSVQVGPLTSTPTLFTASYKFLTSTDTEVNFRVDMEQDSGSAWVANTSKVTLSEWQANEGTSLNTYQETGAEHNPYADPEQYLDREIWTVDRKTTENNVIIEWELTAPYDLMGIRLPRRQCIQNVCTWKYKSSECGYTGTSYFDINDSPVPSSSQDVCGKRLNSCKVRFGAANPLPYGGFPAVGLN